MPRVPWPERLATPDEIRVWRLECEDITRKRLAKELGICERSLAGYEIGEHPIPPLLPWALVGILAPLRSKLRAEAHRERANAARRLKRQAILEAREAEQRERDRRRACRRSIAILGKIAGRTRDGPREAELEELEALDRQYVDNVEPADPVAGSLERRRECRP